MYGCHNEPSLRDALSDPIVQIMMNADRVDPRALELSLRATALKVVRQRPPGKPSDPG